MYVKSRNMLKLRKTVMRPGNAKVCECSKNSTKRRIVQCWRIDTMSAIRTQSNALVPLRVRAASGCVHCVGVLPSGHASFRSKLRHNR